MRQSCSSLYINQIGVLLILGAAASAHGQNIIEYENNATNWVAAAPCHEAYAFDSFYPGMSGTGCLTGSTSPVALQLASGTMTISVFQGATPVCPITDSSTGPFVADVPLANPSSKAVFQFDPAITSFYTYYGSVAVGSTCTMKLYQNNVLQATLTSSPSQNASLAIGHGFDASNTPIDRIEITTTDTGGAVIGAFVGLAAGQSSLGTTTINNYSGPGSSQTVQLDFACTFVGNARVHNVTQNLWHNCIRDAIAWANNGDVIAATQSIYYEAVDFRGKSITITSADPNDPDVVDNTIISAGDRDWSAVRAVNGENQNARLIGMTISGGHGTLASGERRGGGCYILNSSPTLDRCHFIGNSAEEPNGFIGFGGAVYIGDNSTPTISNCTFTGNTAYRGGAIHAKKGGWNLSHCTFTGNSASLRGGAVSIATDSGPGSINITDCTFDGNDAFSQGGAIAAFDLSGLPGGVGITVQLAHCTFTSNGAGGGSGGAIWSSSMRFEIDDCDFRNNRASVGAAIQWQGTGMTNPCIVKNSYFYGNNSKPGDSGGIVTIQATGPEGMFATVQQCIFGGNSGVRVLGINDSTTTIKSCTFAGNGTGASVHANIALIYLDNSIIWDEGVPSVSTSMEGHVLPANCDLKGNDIGGPGVLFSEPLFIDPLGPDGIPGTGDEDLRLSPGSPCINSGVGLYDASNPEFDLAGSPRHQGNVDMGAFEFTLDCNSNGIPDFTEIAQGTLPDCNHNLQCDNCETALDGNCNGVLDMCEIETGALHDVNGNSYPDEFEIGGSISGNVVWSTANGDCVRIATQDVTITGSLTIQAGVRIQIMNGVKWTVVSGGSLNVNGTAESPVEFTSTNVNPAAGNWGGIRFAAGSAGNMSHARIQFTRNHGIRIENAPVSVSGCVISDVAGIDQSRGTNVTPAQVGGIAYGIFVTGNVSPTIARNDIARVRGGRGGDAAFTNGGIDGTYGLAGQTWGQNGQNGGNGVSNGPTGFAGAAGGDAFGIYCGAGSNPTLRDNVVRQINGGDGGLGGSGGNGGWGGEGGDGVQFNIYHWPPICYGGKGGNGGNGKNGGNGAAGGKGADAYGIRIESGAGASILQNLVADIVGGTGGNGGSGGMGGNGGRGGHGRIGMKGFVCALSPGAGVGGNGGTGGNAGAGGTGGNGGKAYGISVGTATSAVVGFVQNTLANIRSGLPGMPGSIGRAGLHGDVGEGGWTIYWVPVPTQTGLYVPIPIPPTDGTPGIDGQQGGPGISGGLGAVTGLRAEGQAILNVANSILAASEPASGVGVTAVGSASLTISYSLLSGFQTPFGPGTDNQGSGNQLGNPMFINPIAGDFHLSARSPAIDSGNNSEVPFELATDLDGFARIADGNHDAIATVDMGAFEVQPSSSSCPTDIAPAGGDGSVNVSDLLAVINQWGTCAGTCPPYCSADINHDCAVNVTDLLAIINTWGVCPN